MNEAYSPKRGDDSRFLGRVNGLCSGELSVLITKRPWDGWQRDYTQRTQNRTNRRAANLGEASLEEGEFGAGIRSSAEITPSMNLKPFLRESINDLKYLSTVFCVFGFTSILISH